jgi:FkbM family methyltransferase
MDLYHYDRPPFTRWVIENGLLREPFVVIDVGVQAGEHPRWDLLGNQVQVHGFDAIDEAIDRLTEKERPGRVYRSLALGNEDGERTFYVAANTFASSFLPYANMEAGDCSGEGRPGPRTVAIRKLDTLFAAGEIPLADYIKINTEGFEQEVLRGARTYLARSNILCVSAKTSFTVTPDFHRTHYPMVNDIVLEHRLQLFDISYWRYARASYLTARAKHPWPQTDPMGDWPDLDIGQPATVDAMFCRDFVMEDKSPERFGRLSDAVLEPTIDKLIKSQINFELHGLMDCAVDIAHHFREQLASRLDVDHAIELLTERPPHARYTRDIVNFQDAILALRKRVTEAEQHHASHIANCRDEIAVLGQRLTEAEQDLAVFRKRVTDAEQDRAGLEANLTSLSFLLGTLSRQFAKRIGLSVKA